MNIQRVKFWANAVSGVVSMVRDYDRDYYVDEEQFETVLDEFLTLWLKEFSLDRIAEDQYGWKLIK